MADNPDWRNALHMTCYLARMFGAPIGSGISDDGSEHIIAWLEADLRIYAHGGFSVQLDPPDSEDADDLAMRKDAVLGYCARRDFQVTFRDNEDDAADETQH